MKQPLTIVRGTTRTISISITNENGTPYSLESGEVIRFGVKKRPSDTEYLFHKEITSPGQEAGVYTFIINPADTENANFGCYYYDVGLQSGTSYFNIIECSEFRITHNVTKRVVIVDGG